MRKIVKNGRVHMKMEIYCEILNIGLNGKSKNTGHRIYAMTGRNVGKSLLLHVELFHCINHQFTFTIFCFIIMIHYVVRAAKPPWKQNGIEVVRVQLSAVA
jgi:hypothetical protein